MTTPASGDQPTYVDPVTGQQLFIDPVTGQLAYNDPAPAPYPQSTYPQLPAYPELPAYPDPMAAFDPATSASPAPTLPGDLALRAGTYPTTGFTTGGYPPPPVAYAPPYPAPYGYGYPMPAMRPPTNGLATASMILSIIGVPLLFCDGIGLIPGIVGLVLGYVGRRQIRERGDSGAGQALAGIIIGWVVIGLAIVIGALIGFAVYYGQHADYNG